MAKSCWVTFTNTFLYDTSKRHRSPHPPTSHTASPTDVAEMKKSPPFLLPLNPQVKGNRRNSILECLPDCLPIYRISHGSGRRYCRSFFRRTFRLAPDRRRRKTSAPTQRPALLPGCRCCSCRCSSVAQVGCCLSGCLPDTLIMDPVHAGQFS